MPDIDDIPRDRVVVQSEVLRENGHTVMLLEDKNRKEKNADGTKKCPFPYMAIRFNAKGEFRVMATYATKSSAKRKFDALVKDGRTRA